MNNPNTESNQLHQRSGKKNQPLLEISDFSISFTQYHQGLRESTSKMIDNLNITIYPGEIVAVVGPSGSGKSLLAHAVLGILPENASTSGSIKYKGKSLKSTNQVKLRGKEIALIPQSINSLDPLMKVGRQVRLGIMGVEKTDKKRIQRHVFRKLGLKDEVENLYPFQLSGGMARRVLMATALVSNAELLIADEPTPGLDERALADTIKPISQLAKEGKGIVFITHDIETALNIADKIAVFYAGTVVEIASTEDFYEGSKALRHPFSKALWDALPQNHFKSSGTLPAGFK